MKLTFKHLALLVAFIVGVQLTATHQANAAEPTGILFAPDSAKHDVKMDRKAIRAKRREIHRDRKDIRKDKRDAAKDIKAGDLKDARKDIKDIRKDRKDIRKDQD